MAGWRWRNPPNRQFTVNKNSPQYRGLVAWWPKQMSGGKIVQDLAGRKYNGLGNGPWVDTPERGRVLSFTAASSQFVDLPENFLASATRWTVSLWVYVLATTLNTSPFGDSLASVNAIPTLRISNESRWEFYAGNGSAFFINAQADTGALVTVGVWDHITFLYNGFDLLVYRNGRLSSTRAATDAQSLSATGTNARIGGGGTGSAGYFTGYVDDVRVHNVALSSQEVWESHNNPFDLIQPIPEPRIWFVAGVAGGISIPVVIHHLRQQQIS